MDYENRAKSAAKVERMQMSAYKKAHSKEQKLPLRVRSMADNFKTLPSRNQSIYRTQIVNKQQPMGNSSGRINDLLVKSTSNVLSTQSQYQPNPEFTKE